jgi:hypothetical protein
MTRRAWLLGCVFLVAAAGCGDDDTIDHGLDDGGAHDASDAATESHEDAGPLVWKPDASVDAGADSNTSSSSPDAGVGISQRECAKRRTPLPQQLLPRCSEMTRSCIMACAQAAKPDECRDACIKADATAAEPTYGLTCATCVYLQLFACIDQADCHEGVAETFCCLADKCPAGSADKCGDMMCKSETNAAITCGYFSKMECLDFLSGDIGQCFGPAGSGDEDAGT